MKPANNAPIYIGAYKELAEIARSHGYAMAVHGSVARDLDLICIPWIEEAAAPQTVVDEITTKFAFKEIDKPPRVREHGRLVYTLSISFGDCFIDLSFMPRADDLRARLETVEAETRERCAKVADGYDNGFGDGEAATAQSIAEDIRNLEPRHD